MSGAERRKLNGTGTEELQRISPLARAMRGICPDCGERLGDSTDCPLCLVAAQEHEAS